MRLQSGSYTALVNIGTNDLLKSNWPVMSFALDLGNVTSTPVQTLFALGLVRDPVLTYLRESNVIQNRSALWWLTWNSVESAVSQLASNELKSNLNFPSQDG